MTKDGKTRCITLGDGFVVPMGVYVAGVKLAIANPDKQFNRCLRDRWPATGRTIRRQFREGMHDRINQAIPYNVRGLVP